MTKRIMFFDTESDGLIKDWKTPYTDVMNIPRMIQLAVAVYTLDESGPKLESSWERLIHPNGWEMPTGQFWIDNGFSQARSVAEGIPIKDALDYFIEWADDCDLMVAHNMNFDSKIIGAEMYRAGKRSTKQVPKFCTMMATIDYCRLPFPRGGNGFKFPKLEELYFILFGEKFDGAHQAGNDATACAECYFELVKRGLI